MRIISADTKIIKPKKCRGCGDDFFPLRPMQTACSINCSVSIARAKRDKAERVAAMLERRATKQALLLIKPRSQLLKEAQAAFNAYIRVRDYGNNCICCDKPLPLDSVGGAYDCGHYRSVGSAPHLRFDERNAHGQLKQCNRWGSGRAVDYRLGLIKKIGIEAVENLESDQSVKKFTREELIAIKDYFKEKKKELQSGLKIQGADHERR